jgi:hypothetical protein
VLNLGYVTVSNISHIDKVIFKSIVVGMVNRDLVRGVYVVSRSQYCTVIVKFGRIVAQKGCALRVDDSYINSNFRMIICAPCRLS